MPSAGDIRVNLPDDERDAIAEAVTIRVQRATETAMQDAWDRLYHAVAHMQDRLGNKETVFRNTLVSNMRDVVDVLARLNVTENEDLEAMRRRVDEELTAFDAESLRDDETLRSATADKAKAILDAMASFYAPAVEEVSAA